MPVEDEHELSDSIFESKTMKSTVNFKSEEAYSLCLKSHSESSKDNCFIRIRIGNRSYKLNWIEISKRNDRSLLTTFAKFNHNDRLKLSDGYLTTTNEYYFERNASVASHIIQYYIDGVLHRPLSVCAMRFKEELDYWRIDVSELSSCCTQMIKFIYPSVRYSQASLREIGSIRQYLWNIMEVPNSSISAKIFAIMSILFILVSITGLVLGTLPEFQLDTFNSSLREAVDYYYRNSNVVLPKFDLHQEAYAMKIPPAQKPMMLIVITEHICMGWFTVDYLIRLIIADKKYDFMRNVLNLIDLATILPFYMDICKEYLNYGPEFLKELAGTLNIARIFRISRIVRLFKFARYSTGLRIFGTTLRYSAPELVLLSMLLFTGVLLFSTCIYILEKDENAHFNSIPSACWWCIITMTTVGYGDVLPVTTVGKIVAAFTNIAGIIVLAFPITMIVDKFAIAQAHVEKAALVEEMKRTKLSKRPSVS